jgi:hypothetical protein
MTAPPPSSVPVRPGTPVPAPAAPAPGGAGIATATIRFIGGAAVLIRAAGFAVLTDPAFLRRGQRTRLGYAAGRDPSPARSITASGAGTRQRTLACKRATLTRTAGPGASGRARRRAAACARLRSTAAPGAP